ncbi:substrate-binding domain-containing protein [Aquincola agrisoli]
MATRQLLADLARRHPLGDVEWQIESTGGVEALRRVADGEAFDLVVLAAEAMARLASAGHLLPGSLAPLAASPMAIASRAGAPAPDVHSAEALRTAVLAAPRIGYSTGPSGTALMALFERWGLTEVLQGRLVQARPGVPVGSLVAEGAADLGFQQLSELLHVPGLTLLGPMPPGLEIITVFSGAVGARSTRPALAQQALDFLASPAALDAKRRHGMAAPDA